MKALVIASLVLAQAISVYADYVVVAYKTSVNAAYPVITVQKQSDLDAVAMRFNNARPGQFPALVHKNTGLWVPVVGGDYGAAETNLLAILQERKTEEQKTYENNFFALTEELLTLTSDERAGQTPPVKLGFPEIQTLIETIQASDPMAAVNYSLKLLTIDAALKRFDIVWWDTAAKHTLAGE